MSWTYNELWDAIEIAGQNPAKMSVGQSPAFDDTEAFKKTLLTTARQTGKTFRNLGDVDAEFAKGGKTLEAMYYTPLGAHATIETFHGQAVARFWGMLARDDGSALERIYEEWPVDGFGLRDHSWGPRTWQAPWYYRWLTANFGDDFGFMGSRIARPDRDGMRGGFIWDGERIIHCRGFEISTDWTEEGSYHRAITATLHHDEGSLAVKGKVLNLIPLRNRRNGLVTRISEGMTEWTLEDGRVGYGLSEYLDQIIDDQPVGIAE